MYTYEYPRPALTADIVIFGFDGAKLKVLLVQRKDDPFKGAWALPGGFMHEDETLEECALRELYEETHFRPLFLKQFHAYSALHRDPRGRVVTVAFFSLMPISEVSGGTDAIEARWFDIDEVHDLAFDHETILSAAQQHMRERLYFEPIAFQLLPRKFTMTQLQHVYEIVLGVTFDRRNFYKKMLSTQIVFPLDEYRSGSQSRPAQLYTFVPERYRIFKNHSSMTEF